MCVCVLHRVGTQLNIMSLRIDMMNTDLQVPVPTCTCTHPCHFVRPTFKRHRSIDITCLSVDTQRIVIVSLYFHVDLVN